MPVTVGNIQIHMGPDGTGGPDALRQPIVDFIDGANTRLLIAVQEIEDEEITRAIVRARQRKLLVKVVVEGDYLKTSKAAADPFAPGGENEENRRLYNAVLRANVDVKSDYNTSIFHQKFIVRDSSAVLTGSTNFTTTGVENNLNHLVIVNSQALVNDYRREFDEIQAGRFGKRSADDNKPRELDISGVRVKALFAPEHAPEMEIMKQMQKAKDRIDFAIFTFSQSSGIDDTMKVMARNGVTVRGIFDKRQANQSWAASHALLGEPNVDICVAAPQGNMRKLHHKLMVIDKQVVIAGSFNYTGPANLLNDENIVVIGDLEANNQATINKQKQIAQYCFDEIQRICDTFGEPFQ